MASLLSKLFQFVMITSSNFKIDETHGIAHSMHVLHNAHNIYETEKLTNLNLKKHEQIIYLSAVLHDMCDNKYMNHNDGLYRIETFLGDKIEKPDINVIKEIVSTMSYSKVKKDGFPDLGEYQTAYHIVREADLLSAYDFDRCILYNMHNRNVDIHESFDNAYDLFQRRMFQHANDGLFITKYSKNNYKALETNAMARIDVWKKLLKNPTLL